MNEFLEKYPGCGDYEEVVQAQGMTYKGSAGTYCCGHKVEFFKGWDSIIFCPTCLKGIRYLIPGYYMPVQLSMDLTPADVFEGKIY